MTAALSPGFRIGGSVFAQGSDALAASGVPAVGNVTGTGVLYRYSRTSGVGSGVMIMDSLNGIRMKSSPVRLFILTRRYRFRRRTDLCSIVHRSRYIWVSSGARALLYPRFIASSAGIATP